MDHSMKMHSFSNWQDAKRFLFRPFFDFCFFSATFFGSQKMTKQCLQLHIGYLASKTDKMLHVVA